MNKAEILAMTAGPKLDLMVTEEVMGGGFIKSYSTDISEAWKVVEKMKKKSLFSQRRIFMNTLQEVTSESVDLPKGTVINWSDMLFWITPENICKAALITTIKE